MIVYINGNLLPISQARISPLDYGFLYGFSLFETLRSYNGRLFRLDKHLARLRQGDHVLGMTNPPEDAEIEKAIRLTLQANNLTEARVRLTYSLGEGSLVPDLDSCRQPVFMVAAAPFTPPDEETYERGYKIIISEHHRDSQSILSRIKSGNYLPSLLARQEARKKGAQEALLLNEKGAISECSASNIFLVKNGNLITPDVKSGILPGITREEVLKIGSSLGLIIEEREVVFEELLQAEEDFITNSLLEIMPVAEIDGRTMGGVYCGPITKELRSAYKDIVSKDSS